MKTEPYFLSPVMVVKVTAQNMDEVAEWCGGLVQETESRRVQGRMDKYVLVPTPKEAKVSWAFPGMFVTKRLVITMKGELKATWAVFRRDYFEKNYFESPEAAAAATWEREHDESLKPKEEVTVNVSVGDALKDAALAQIRKIAEKSGANITINVSDQHDGAEQIITPGTEITQVYSKQRIDREDLEDATPNSPQYVEGDVEQFEQDDETPTPSEDIPALFEHNHLLSERCDEAGCEADRYLDGEHFFTDKVVNTMGDEEVIRERQVAK